MIKSFKDNRISFFAVFHTNDKHNQEDDNASILMSSFFYSFEYRSIISSLVNQRKIDNPKASMRPVDISANQVKSIYSESNSTFTFGETPTKDPPLNSLKAKKSKKDLVLFDFSGVFFSSSEMLKKLHKFNHIVYFSFYDCGLVDVPNELFTLPKSTRTLDFRKNYISNIPNDVHWKHLECIVLSENSLNFWPAALDPDKMPNIITIDLSYNQILNFRASKMTFLNLQNLILDYTPLKSFPTWITQCPKIKYLSLSGCNSINNFSFQLVATMYDLEVLCLSGVGIPRKEFFVKVPQALKIITARGVNRECIPNGHCSMFV